MGSALSSQLSEKHRGRPAHARDFDLPLALHNLRDVAETPQRREWATPLWQNALGVALFLLAGGTSLSVWHFNPEVRISADAPWLSAGLVLALLFLAFVLAAAVAMALHRGRLVLDRKARCLRFSRSLLWPRETARLAFDDIEALVMRKLDSPQTGEEAPWTYRIDMAELRDGRLASIAFDSPSVGYAVRQAIEADRAGPPRLLT